MARRLLLGLLDLKHTGVRNERGASKADSWVGRCADQAGALLRRLSIVCPQTGRDADTGFALTELPGLSARRQVLVDCLECGQDHEWTVNDIHLR